MSVDDLHRDLLDDNLDRLLSCAAPAPRMPAAVRQRIRLELLTGAATDTGERSWFRRNAGRLAPWLAAAATVLAVVLIGHGPGRSPGSLSWASVADFIGGTRTISALSTTITIESDGPAGPTQYATLFFRDPGLSRYERWTEGTEGSQEIVVTHRWPGRAEQLILSPDRRIARHISYRFRGAAAETRPIVEMVAESWRRISAITSEATRGIGERSVAGIEATGFSAPLSALFDRPAPGVHDGVVRIWAETETAVPVLIELSFRDEVGTRHETTLSSIKWDIHLGDELFELVAPIDWRDFETRLEILELEGATFAAGVSFSIAPENAPPLVTEAEVVAVLGGEATEEPDLGAPAQLRLTLELTPDASERLHTFARDNPHHLLVADFNGQTRVVPELGPPDTTLLTLDLSRLGLSLGAVERDYLATSSNSSRREENRP